MTYYLSHILCNNFDDNRDGLFLNLLSNIRKYMLYVASSQLLYYDVMAMEIIYNYCTHCTVPILDF